MAFLCELIFGIVISDMPAAITKQFPHVQTPKYCRRAQNNDQVTLLNVYEIETIKRL